MDEDKFEQLIKDHPVIFEKSGNFELSVGDGWYNIIDSLFSLIEMDYEYAQSRLDFAMKHPDGIEKDSISILERAVEVAYEKIPVVVQVKEKFGALRFYTNGHDDNIDNYIRFAEVMSGKTCEECGAPGKIRNNFWYKSLCDFHHEKREKNLPK